MLREIILSEERCSQYMQKAARWLRELYSPNDMAFYISISGNEVLEPIQFPNVATSHIGVIVEELSGLNENHLSKEEAELLRSVQHARSHFLALPPSDLLPLETFGPLPAFSTTFVSEFLSSDRNCLESWSYAILVRRILYLMCSELSRDPRAGDMLHPYLWYRIARAVRGLKSAMSLNGELKASFLEKLRDRTRMLSFVPILASTPSLPLGFDSDPEFAAYLNGFEFESLDKLLQQIERQALNNASTELAWRGTPRKDRADPGKLLFSVATLALLNQEKHELLVAQSVPTILEAFENGTLSVKAPFNIDDRGRALFVTTLESASTLTSILLAFCADLSNDGLQKLFSVTDEIQSRAIEDINDVPCMFEGRQTHRSGWCSDKAYSGNRIDSWVTVHGLAFLARRSKLIRYIKKRDVLSRYSWVPSIQCRPAWEELDDPNLGEVEADLLLANVERIASTPGSEREKAPLFLLYGPPGTAKTSVAYALARRLNWDLITLSPSDFVLNSLDKIEQRSREIFDDLANVENCVVLFDEMDTLLRDREVLWTSSPGMMIEFVVPALLPKLQQFRDYAMRRPIAAFFVTNFYERLDSALTRAGRIDNHMVVLPYSRDAQLAVGTKLLRRRFSGDQARASAVIEELKSVLRDSFCNLTYRDMDEICTDLARGNSSAEKLRAKIKSAGLSPEEIYSQKRSEKAYLELYAFMRRYRGQHVVSQVNRDEVIEYFSECCDALPQFSQFLSGWIEQLKKSGPSVSEAHQGQSKEVTT